MKNDNDKQIEEPTIIDEMVSREQDSIKPEEKHLFKKIIWGLVMFIVFIVAVQILVADKYQAQVLVIGGEKKVGVNPTTERLDFGDLSGDTSATRFISFQADGMGTFVSVWKFGSIAELIKLSDNNFTLQKGDEKKLEFNLYMPVSAPVGEKYTGWVWIFKIPKLW